jgi:hypothetical protein
MAGLLIRSKYLMPRRKVIYIFAARLSEAKLFEESKFLVFSLDINTL